MTRVLRYDTLEPKKLFYPLAGNIALFQIDIHLSNQIYLSKDILVLVRSREGTGLRIPSKLLIEAGTYTLPQIAKKLEPDSIVVTEKQLKIPDTKEMQMTKSLYEALLNANFEDGLIHDQHSLKKAPFPKHLYLICEELLESEQMLNGKPAKILTSLTASQKNLSYEPKNPVFLKLDPIHHQYSKLTLTLLDENSQVIQPKSINFTLLINERV